MYMTLYECVCVCVYAYMCECMHHMALFSHTEPLHVMMPGSGEVGGNTCGKDKNCSKWRAIAANHRAEPQSAQAYTISDRASLSNSETARLADLYSNQEMVIMHIPMYITISTIIAMVVRQGLEDKVWGLLVSVYVQHWTHVTWALLLDCCSFVQQNCGRPQQRWCHDTRGMACCLGMSPRSEKRRSLFLNVQMLLFSN